MITQGIQNNLIYQLYKNGCYFLSICSIIDDMIGGHIDIIDYAQLCIAKGYLGHDMYVKDAAGIIRNYTHKGVIVTKSEQRPSEADYIIEHWTRGDASHFRRPEVDTWLDSQIVAYGALKDYRAIYTSA